MRRLDRWLDEEFETPSDRMVRASKRIGTASRAAGRSLEQGNVPDLRKALQQLDASGDELARTAATLRRAAESYDINEYIDRQLDGELRRACTEAGLDIEGTYPTYWVVPVRLDVDRRQGRIRVNGKLLKGLRMSHVVEGVVRERDRIRNRRFSAQRFLTELAGAYDTVVSVERARRGVDVSGQAMDLKRVYAQLTPRREWRAQYPDTFFTYDLHRLLVSDETHLRDGRRYFLSPARNSRSNLSILDRNDRYVQYGAIAFRKEA